MNSIEIVSFWTQNTLIYLLSAIAILDKLQAATGTNHRNRNLSGMLLGIDDRLAFDPKLDSIVGSKPYAAAAAQQWNNSNGTRNRRRKKTKTVKVCASGER